MSAVPKLTAAVLRRQDDVCSAAVVQLLASNVSFQRLAQSEGEGIVRRDREDDEKLAKGVEIGIRKGILPARPQVPPVREVNVVGLTAQEVGERIAAQLPSREGNVIVLQGLSGTGKGTTVAKLQQLLPRCMAWSNGNVFRCYTHLCAEALAAAHKEISAETLTDELLAAAGRRLSFDRMPDGSYDVLIDGTTRVRDIQNTLLKAPLISHKVPTVAEQTQGEVVTFAAAAVKRLSEDGYNVIMEGRAQTLQYVPTTERFELVIPDVALLGQRRAAQRVMAKALELVGGPDAATATPDDADVSATVVTAVEQL